MINNNNLCENALFFDNKAYLFVVYKILREKTMNSKCKNSKNYYIS
ncbi:Uncharacterised protein [Mycobacteroides abscessus subsp. abscessus]|nr:Uncharacterised protein [Mycobacteroides abscessus subsp. abscessus]